MRLKPLTSLVVFLTAASAAPVFAGTGTCAGLATALKAATGIRAEVVAPGKFSPPDGGRRGGGRGSAYDDLPEFCRVAVTLAPSSDSDIKVEVWLPAAGWNGKFQAVGNGGWAGTISYAAMADALRAGYATASTDTGHVGGRGTFALDHPEKLIDFSWRSEHEMTVKAKTLIEAFYGAAPKRSYWNGCSTGGRQGLKEAQMFPGRLRRHHRRGAREPHGDFTVDRPRGPEGSRELHSPRPSTGAASGGACGLRRGRRPQGRPHRRSDEVRFDPAVLLCKGGDGPSCLTEAQVDGGEEDLFPGGQSPYRRRAVLVAGAGHRTRLGHPGRGPRAVGQHLRPVPLRRIQGPELGLEDVRLRQGRGARRSSRERDHERHQSGYERVLLARREAAALSRVERQPRADAEHGQVLQRGREESRRGVEGRRQSAVVPGARHGSLRRRRGPERVRQGRSAGTVGRAGEGARHASSPRKPPMARSIGLVRCVRIRRSSNTRAPAASTTRQTSCALRRRDEHPPSGYSAAPNTTRPPTIVSVGRMCLISAAGTVM